MMTETISWLDADRRDAAVASLVAKLTRKNQSVENGGCGCGCGDGSVTRATTAPSKVKKA